MFDIKAINLSLNKESPIDEFKLTEEVFGACCTTEAANVILVASNKCEMVVYP